LLPVGATDSGLLPHLVRTKIQPVPNGLDFLSFSRIYSVVQIDEIEAGQNGLDFYVLEKE